MQRSNTLCALSALCAAAALTAPAAAHAADLDLATVLARVAASNPQLAARSAAIEEAEGHELQAGLFRNPRLSTEVENFAGSGEFSGTDRAETTIMLSQELEIGGVRKRRRRAASLGSEVATRDYDRTRAAIDRAAAIAFVDVLSEQRLRALADEEIELADRVIASVRRRVEAGSLSRVELARAEIARSRAQLDRSNVERALRRARLRLAATWGALEPDFERAVARLGIRAQPGDGAADGAVPTLEQLQVRLRANPELARWASESARRQALVDVEERKAIPDVTIGAGYRRLSGPEQNAMVAELSVPLPLFDRNQGRVEAARASAARAHSEQRAAEVELRTELARSYEAMTSARAQNIVLEEKILPQQAKAFEDLSVGFREGRFDYLEVLDAQRTLVASRAQRVGALADYHRAVVTIEWLTGAPTTAGLLATGGEGAN